MLLNRIRRFEVVIPCLLVLALPAGQVRADIFEWEYINPADPSQGKQASATLVPDGAGADAVPRADLRDLDLTMAYLRAADLTGAWFGGATLADAVFAGADLTDALFDRVNIQGADFTESVVAGTDFFLGHGRNSSSRTLTELQLMSTASYKAGDLSGIGLGRNNLSGWNLSAKNLNGASFFESVLTGTDLTNATITGARFTRTTGDNGFTQAQLMSTANYKSGDLIGVRLDGNDLSGWDFSGLNLAEAVFSRATTVGADFSGANITGAQMNSVVEFGFTKQQLYNTSSYIDGDMTGLNLNANDLSGWDFSGKILSQAHLSNTILTGTDFSGSDLRGATVRLAEMIGVNLEGADIRAATFNQSILDGADLSGFDLSGAEFESTSLINADLSGTTLRGTEFLAANFTGTDLTDADVRSAFFTNVTFGGFTEDHFRSTANFKAGDLTSTSWSQNDMRGWDLSNLVIESTNLVRNDLREADFSHSSLANSRLTESDFTDAIITGANFEGAVQYNFTEQQLMSTANYKAGDLRGIGLSKNDLTGWDLSGQDLSGANFHRAILVGSVFSGAIIRGADLSLTVGFGFNEQQLASTASYKAGDLRGIVLARNDLTGWDLSGQDLTGASLFGALLTDMNLAGAIVSGTDFSSAVVRGLTEAMLMSTASYQAQDLSGILLARNNMTGWDLSGQNLSMSSFVGSTLTGVDLSGSDTRGASLTDAQIDTAGDTTNLIWPDGTMRDGLVLVGGGVFRLVDHEPLVIEPGDTDSIEQGIIIQGFFGIGDTGTLRVVFEDLDWNSLIRFDPSVGTAFLGGVLQLDVALKDGLAVEDLLGSTYQLFDWSGVIIDGEFDQIVVDPVFTDAGLRFDTSDLYITGEVALVPEPAMGVILSAGGVCLLRRRRRSD